MRRVVCTLLVTLSLLTVTSSADAGWTEFWDRVFLDWNRVNAWPEPFIHADRDAARAPFTAMVTNGWERQTTLGDYHFDPQTQQLTRGGVNKLRWILTQVPESRRTVFVHSSANRDITAMRIDSVQQATARVLPNGALPAVLRTNTEPPGWPADYIDAIDRSARSTIPAPRLPEIQSGG